jgi:hypothetical protein
VSLRNSTIPNDFRLAVIRDLIRVTARDTRSGKPGAVDRQNVLKSIAAELQSRIDSGALKTLTAIDEQLADLTKVPGPHTNSPGLMIRLAMVTIQHWPLIRAALESYRENQTS